MTVKICCMDGCGRVRYSASTGLCRPHYRRLRKYGDPTAGRPLWGEISNWLKDHADWESNNCLIWPYGFSDNGYGRVFYDGEITHAHRLMCILAHGDPQPPRSHAAHSCGDRSCVNPKHLRWATRRENMQDGIEHGTIRRGEDRPQAKLRLADIKDILSAPSSVFGRELALKYGVSESTISAIRRRELWRHV